MKHPALKYLFDNKTKMKSSFQIFKQTFWKNQDCLPIKKRKKIHKLIKKIGEQLL